MSGNWMFDGEGIEFSDLTRLQSLASQGKITAQQKKLLDEIVRQRKDRDKEREHRERQRLDEIAVRASLPDCPFCGHKLPKANVILCGQCRSKLYWLSPEFGFGPKPFRSREEAEAHRAAEIARQRKTREWVQRQEQGESNAAEVSRLAAILKPFVDSVGGSVSTPDAFTFLQSRGESVSLQDALEALNHISTLRRSAPKASPAGSGTSGCLFGAVLFGLSVASICTLAVSVIPR